MAIYNLNIIDFKELTDEIYCARYCDNCEKCRENKPESIFAKLNLEGCVEKIYIENKTQQKEDDRINKNEATKDISNEIKRVQDILKRRLISLYKKFDDKNYAFNKFPIKTFDKKAQNAVLKKLLYMTPKDDEYTSVDRQIIDNIFSKQSIEYDFYSFYMMSDKPLVDVTFDKLKKTFTSDISAKNYLTPEILSLPKSTALKWAFQLDKEFYIELVSNEERILNYILDQNKKDVKANDASDEILSSLSRTQYAYHCGRPTLYELLKSSMRYVINNLMRYSFRILEKLNVLLLPQIDPDDKKDLPDIDEALINNIQLIFENNQDKVTTAALYNIK